MRRPQFLLAGPLAALVLVAPALYAQLFVGRQCGADGQPAPAQGSALDTFCQVANSSDERIVVAGALLLYAPIWLPIAAGWFAANNGTASTFWRGVAYSVALLGIWLGLSAVLPAA
jgi:hypothetical protein